MALDADQLAVERLFQALKAEGVKTILPLVNNLADPSPNLGWRGLERKALANRTKPELVLCLALVHHLVISAQYSFRGVCRVACKPRRGSRDRVHHQRRRNGADAAAQQGGQLFRL